MNLAIAPEIAESPAAVEESFAAVEDSLADPASVTEITDAFSLDAAAEAEDDAVLARIAMEMAAPDPEFDEIVEPMAMAAAVPEPMPEPIAAEVAEPVVMEARRVRQRKAADKRSAVGNLYSHHNSAIPDPNVLTMLVQL